MSFEAVACHLPFEEVTPLQPAGSAWLRTPSEGISRSLLTHRGTGVKRVKLLKHVRCAECLPASIMAHLSSTIQVAPDKARSTFHKVPEVAKRAT